MIKELFTYGKNYAAVEHAENGMFNVLQLTKKKDEFVVLKQQQVYSIQDCIKELNGQKHFFLIVNDAQVLSKKITLNQTDSISIIRKAYPSIAINDFYFEIYSNQYDSFISLVRKKVVDDFITEYNKAGISVVDFSLGNLAIKNLQSVINSKNICTSNAEIDFEEGVVSHIEKETIIKKNYTINDLEVSNESILSLGGIISYYSKNASSQIYKELKDNFIQKRFFDLGLKSGLGFILVVLLVNFFFFSSYRDQVGSLSGELQLSNTYKKQLNKLQEEVTQKKQLVESVNSASNSKLSKYIDELGNSVPETVLLSQIQYHPIQGMQKADKKMLFEKHKIVVKGTSKVEEDFSTWISVLEKTLWIQNVSIKEYGKGNNTTSISAFEFLIETDD